PGAEEGGGDRGAARDVPPDGRRDRHRVGGAGAVVLPGQGARHHGHLPGANRRAGGHGAADTDDSGYGATAAAGRATGRRAAPEAAGDLTVSPSDARSIRRRPPWGMGDLLAALHELREQPDPGIALAFWRHERRGAGAMGLQRLVEAPII